MDVTINAIKFNHDTESGTKDAITIRKNEATNIAVPEWEVDKKGELHTSAAAYAKSARSNVTIAVQLKRLNPAVQRVEVSTQSKGLLGNSVKATEIIFSRRDDLSDFALVEFQNTTLSSAVVRRSEIELEWSFRVILNNGQQPDTPPQRTNHVIYTLLAPPKAPWAPDEESSDFEHPWTDVLDLVCGWADGARDTTEVATRITTRLFAFGPEKLKHVLARGSSALPYPGTAEFNCTKFLNHLTNGTDPLLIDCTDCAILASSFANILGCDLYQSRMGSTEPFGTNHIRLIGSEADDAFPEGFKYHEVAWESPCDSTAKLFDCCLQVDGDSRPASKPFVPLLPVNIRFGEPGSDYHFRLVPPGGHCEARPDTMTRRRIARQRIHLLKIDPVLELMLKKEFDYSSWKEVPAPDPLFSGPIENLNEGFLPVGWESQQPRVFNGEVDDLSMTETRWKSTTSDDVALRVLTYKRGSVLAAREFLLNLLGEFELPVIRQRLDFEKNSGRVAIGELAFSVPEDLALLFVRSNLVVFIQNAGSTIVPVSSFAHDIDTRILKVLRNEGGETLQTTELVSTLQKEKRKMLIGEVLGRWSSNRPTGNGPTPNDTKPDGIFEFKTYDPLTGAVTGDYYDVKIHETRPFQGTITFNGGDNYVFTLSHVVPPDNPPRERRIYKGQTVADDGTVVVIVGRWQEVPLRQNRSEQEKESIDIEAALSGQNDGVWVATKP